MANIMVSEQGIKVEGVLSMVLVCNKLKRKIETREIINNSCSRLKHRATLKYGL